VRAAYDSCTITAPIDVRASNGVRSLISVSKSIRSNRIYFLLDRFDEAVDGHINTMVFPE
jgi:hypothetical protein